jgi:hypothetical protein
VGGNFHNIVDIVKWSFKTEGQELT